MRSLEVLHEDLAKLAEKLEKDGFAINYEIWNDNEENFPCCEITGDYNMKISIHENRPMIYVGYGFNYNTQNIITEFKKMFKNDKQIVQIPKDYQY